MHYRFCSLFVHFGTLLDNITYSAMLFDDLLKTCILPFTVELEDQMILIVKEFSKNEKLISPISKILQPLHNGWLSGRLGAFEEVEANSIRSIWIANIDSFPHWRFPQPDLDFSNLLKNSHTLNVQPERSWNWVQIVWFITTLVPVSLLLVMFGHGLSPIWRDFPWSQPRVSYRWCIWVR